ncbi:MAG: tyrosine-type recombinase/integrase [Rhizobiales bacterium]|nr:tyrosine-type recombinase/integrase [Hyphomicrobiales bacterium]
MARKVRDATMDSKDARHKLKVRGKPHYRRIGPGLHLGYRRLKGKDGTWVARFYLGDQQYAVEAIGTADDLNDADGETILTFDQAVDEARNRMAARVPTGEGQTAAPLTVGEAVTAYVAERDRRDSKRRGREVCSDAGHRLRRYVLGQAARGKQDAIGPAPLATVTLHALDDPDLLEWRAALPDTLAGTTKQRLINDLKAALNGAHERHRKQLPATLQGTIRYALKAEVDDDDDGGVRGNQILTDGQVSRLIGAARGVDAERHEEGDLYRLVLVLAATGARFSQIARMRVRDCQPGNRRLLIPTSRKGKGTKASHTTVPVGQDVVEALAPTVVGRKANAWLLERWRYRQVKGGRWERMGRGPWQASSEFNKPWHTIRERAELPEVIPYALRHSSIVRSIRQNVPTRLVAALHDTSVLMIERHYSRWIVDGLEELAARAIVPLVPQEDGGRVVPMRGR